MSTYKSFSGYCPHIQDENEIEIEYAEILMRQTSKEHFKRISFECSTDLDEDNGCPYADKEKCPLYEKAPVTIEK